MAAWARTSSERSPTRPTRSGTVDTRAMVRDVGPHHGPRDNEGVGHVRHLYVHVPFCAHRCGYCDFVTVTGRAGAHAPYVEALERELPRAATCWRRGWRRSTSSNT